ncbi:hypothetical protein [Serratia odorifera]|jgi:hypothetical protein|uniref:Uncharacterized protein n=2 Tax=Serratia odorifera TaxID=618 RepID=D4E083_SEROD|nr:hypothetical protein [Serratia odorifera]EFE96724.1 hypothetical protein HMPREF0758_1583 [Serratia odorifera DSM 4582]MBJ2067802.1 hypothetical protein [Serratia odorifera]PNK91332.1 hypothetical protein CEQ31_017440 [Serratia odorifera]RII72580.1 hypothetical protein DX901_08990 [Serratia odorifera]VDZ56156.1 Uncharacterised protein [Serratia odorifera]
MKKGLLACIVFILVIIASMKWQFWAGYATSPESKEIDCRAVLNIVTPEQLHFTGVMKMHAVNGKGLALIEGNYHQASEAPTVLNRKVFFDYSQNEDMLSMHSNKVARLPSDNADESVLATLLPTFYFRPDITHNIGLYKQGSGYIFAGTVIPFVYCVKG